MAVELLCKASTIVVWRMGMPQEPHFSTAIIYIYVAVCHVLDGGDGESTAAIH